MLTQLAMGCGQSKKIHLYPRKNKSKSNGKKGHGEWGFQLIEFKVFQPPTQFTLSSHVPTSSSFVSVRSNFLSHLMLLFTWSFPPIAQIDIGTFACDNNSRVVGLGSGLTRASRGRLSKVVKVRGSLDEGEKSLICLSVSVPRTLVWTSLLIPFPPLTHHYQSELKRRRRRKILSISVFLSRSVHGSTDSIRRGRKRKTFFFIFVFHFQLSFSFRSVRFMIQHTAPMKHSFVLCVAFVRHCMLPWDSQQLVRMREVVQPN